MSALDALTGRAMVVLQDRPLVAMSPWLTDALREPGRGGLQVVTPPTSRLTLPLRQVLTGELGMWVIRDGDAYYDGMTGRPLRWDGDQFVPTPEFRDYAPGFAARTTEPITPLPALLYRVRHADDGTLAAATETLFRLLTGEPPAGWGPAEPVAHPWDRARLIEHVRRQGGRATRVVALGGAARRAIATMEFSAEGELVESATLLLGPAGHGPLYDTDFPAMIGALVARHPVESLLSQLIPGRSDLTFEPRWTGAPAPIGVAVAGLRVGPPDLPMQQVGPPGAPMSCFALGDGQSPDGWKRYQDLLRHLQSPG